MSYNNLVLLKRPVYVPPVQRVIRSHYVYLIEPYAKQTISVRVGTCNKTHFKENIEQYFQHSTNLYLWHVVNGKTEHDYFHNRFEDSFIVYDVYEKEKLEDYISFLTRRNGKPDKFVNP